jgi:hypothetical protein
MPLIHQVIPIFDIVTTALKDNIDKSTLPLAVHHAALQGYLMLNKYYSLMDESVVYHIAMSGFLTFSSLGYLSFLVILVLHPCYKYKTTYFSRAKWPQQWITDAEVLATKVWTEKYKKVTPPALSRPRQGDCDVNHVCMGIDQYFLFLHLFRRNPLEWTGIPVESAGMDRNPQE